MRLSPVDRVLDWQYVDRVAESLLSMRSSAVDRALHCQCVDREFESLFSMRSSPVAFDKALAGNIWAVRLNPCIQLILAQLTGY
ncbi:hypothetical protein DPMN_193786 [Dreissena polymorpha]|uniref:Uncharacterized protein n=1 Tax=Dreissena polymorpha TaxID=45954 RepID=A0A9D4BEZ5_DREPO|nr:hypothetical protein DPMN_193786 [Dreissena polymorpha]